MGLNAWQLMAWIAGLELISIPLIIFTANAIMIGYFKIKKEFVSTVVHSFGKAMEDTIKDVLNKKDEGDKNVLR